MAEEERTRQRRTELDILQASLRGGIPAPLIPVVFAGMGGETAGPRGTDASPPDSCTSKTQQPAPNVGMPAGGGPLLLEHSRDPHAQGHGAHPASAGAPPTATSAHGPQAAFAPQYPAGSPTRPRGYSVPGPGGQGGHPGGPGLPGLNTNLQPQQPQQHQQQHQQQQQPQHQQQPPQQPQGLGGPVMPPHVGMATGQRHRRRRRHRRSTSSTGHLRHPQQARAARTRPSRLRVCPNQDRRAPLTSDARNPDRRALWANGAANGSSIRGIASETQSYRASAAPPPPPGQRFTSPPASYGPAAAVESA